MIRTTLGAAAALILAAAALDADPAAAGPKPAGWAAVAALLPSLALAAAAILRTRARAPDPSSLEARRLGELCLLLVVAGHAVVLFPLGWGGWVLDELGWRARPRAAFFFLAAPAAALALWLSPWLALARRLFLSGAPPERFSGRPLDPARRLSASLAALALVALPALAADAAAPDDFLALYPGLAAALLAPGAALVFGLAPYLLRLAVRTRPLPPEALRRLEEIAARSRTRLPAARAAAAWEGTAGAAGWIPGTHLVLFGERFLRQADGGTLDAVFAHELGHVRLGHGIWNLLCVLALALLFAAVASAAKRGIPPAFAAASLVGAWAFWFAVASRSAKGFELEADLAAAGAVGSAPYAAALARLGGRPGAAGARDWRHPAREDRLAILAEALRDREAARRLERSLRRRRRELAAAAAVSALVFALAAASEAGRGPAVLARERARTAAARAAALRPIAFGRERRALGAPPWLAVPREAVRAAYARELERAEASIERARRLDQGAATGFDASNLEAPDSTSKLQVQPAVPSGT